MLVGITGNSGAGKSSLIQEAKKEVEFYLIDADKIGHDILFHDKCKEEVVACFGNDILVDNEIDRKKVSKIVFHDRDKLLKLTEITHKYIIEEIFNIIYKNEQNYDIIIVDAPLLVESGLYKKMDTNILIAAKTEDKVKRIMERDSIDELTANNRLMFQTMQEELAKKCEHIIVNEDFNESSNKLVQILKGIVKK